MKTKSILIALFFALFLNAQERDKLPLFGAAASPASLDTTTQASPKIVSRTIKFNEKQGTFTLYGHSKVLSGNAQPITVTMRLLNDQYEDDYSPVYSVGEIPAAADTAYTFPVSRNAWWTGCEGAEVTYVFPDTGTFQIEVKGVANIW